MIVSLLEIILKQTLIMLLHSDLLQLRMVKIVWQSELLRRQKRLVHSLVDLNLLLMDMIVSLCDLVSLQRVIIVWQWVHELKQMDLSL